MAVTLLNLLDEMAAGYLEPADVLTTLNAAIASTSVQTFTTAGLPKPAGIGSIVEIDNELMRVTNLTRGASDTYTVTRGVEGSTAATHSSGAGVAVNPKYPRYKRIAALNRVYTDWLGLKLPRVLQDSSQLFSAISDTLAIPAGVSNLLEVAYKPPGFTELVPLRYGRPRPYPVAIASTGFGVKLFDIGPPGYTAYVSYTTPWGPNLVADTDQLPADWVFGESLLVSGATASLLGAKFSKRATFDSAHTQRAEDKAGQSQMLTREARREAEQEFQGLLEGFMQDWWGAKVPAYWEGGV